MPNCQARQCLPTQTTQKANRRLLVHSPTTRTQLTHKHGTKHVQTSCISGYKTNHSLQVTTATWLYQASIDEQLMMERTGHRSLDGVRFYKRTNWRRAEADAVWYRQPLCVTSQGNKNWFEFHFVIYSSFSSAMQQHYNKLQHTSVT